MSEEQQHTPGPWSIFLREFREIEIVAVYGDPSIDESQLTPAKITKGVNAWANAYLIASAPDLLAACEATLKAEDKQSQAQARRLIEEAVSKAKGETQED